MFNTPEQLRKKLKATQDQELFDHTKQVISQTLEEYIAGNRFYNYDKNTYDDVLHCSLNHKEYEIYLSSFKKYLIENGWIVQEWYYDYEFGSKLKLISDVPPSKEETDIIILAIKEK